MNRIQFRACVAVGSLIVLAVGAQTAAAQKARNPIFIVVPFHSTGEPKLGLDIAEAVRDRMTHYYQQKPTIRPGSLRIITQQEINNYLSTSGFLPDSAMSTNELKDLGRTMGAEESMEGTAKRTAAGVEVHVKFYSLNFVGAAEVLPPIVEKNADNAGRAIADAYFNARKELADYQKCRGGLMGNDPDQAVQGARAALTQYDRGVLPRACLMNAYFRQYQAKKLPIDSTIKVAQDILRIDADNELAIGQLADAYSVSGDTAKAIQMNIRLYQMNPGNINQAKTTIQILASSGAPDQAIPIVKDIIANNPGDPSFQDTYWKLLQAAKQWKLAIAAGEELVKLDTARADTNYFNRQISDAIADSQPALELQYLGKATAKFPNNTRYWMGYSQELRKQGQVQPSLDAAKKVLALDPKFPGIQATILTLYAALGQPDSAMAFAKTAIGAGVDKSAVGAALLPLIKPAMTKAQATDARPDWEEVFRVSSTVDSLAPTPNTAFYMSYAAFTIGTKALTGIAEIAKTDKAKACAENKVASDMFLVMDLNMSRGAKVDQGTAVKLLNALSTYRPYIDQYKKTIPCK